MRKQIIVAMSGRKNAGKNTIATFIAKHFAMLYPAQDNTHSYWKRTLHLEEIVGAYVFECSFADQLKDFCINTLGLRREQCYGSDDEKNSPTEYKWKDASKFLAWKFGDEYGGKLVADGETQDGLMWIFHKRLFKTLDGFIMTYRDGFMTGREVMQIVGTDLMRQTFGNIWAAATIRTIKKNKKPLNIVTDNRFPNEVKAVLAEPNGYIIRLTRSPFGTEDVHPSESALDDYDWKKERFYV